MTEKNIEEAKAIILDWVYRYRNLSGEDLEIEVERLLLYQICQLFSVDKDLRGKLVDLKIPWQEDMVYFDGEHYRLNQVVIDQILALIKPVKLRRLMDEEIQKAIGQNHIFRWYSPSPTRPNQVR